MYTARTCAASTRELEMGFDEGIEGAAFVEMMALRRMDRNRGTSDCDLERAIWKNRCVAAIRAVPENGAPSRGTGEDSGLAAAERWVDDEGMDELGAHSRRVRERRRRGLRAAGV
jgi:hypothetical protein